MRRRVGRSIWPAGKPSASWDLTSGASRAAEGPGARGTRRRRKKRTALLRKLKEMFQRHESNRADRVIDLINPVLRGWVRYFAVGDSHRCFGFIKDWVEKKVRRHLMRARNRKGFGWKEVEQAVAV